MRANLSVIVSDVVCRKAAGGVCLLPELIFCVWMCCKATMFCMLRTVSVSGSLACQVARYALSMHGVVSDAAKVKAGSAGATFKAAVAEATARATGAR